MRNQSFTGGRMATTAVTEHKINKHGGFAAGCHDTWSQTSYRTVLRETVISRRNAALPRKARSLLNPV